MINSDVTPPQSQYSVALLHVLNILFTNKISLNSNADILGSEARLLPQLANTRAVEFNDQH